MSITDEYTPRELELKFAKNYLLHRENGILADSITQRLLNIRLRFTDQTRFNELCSEGIQFYRRRLAYDGSLHPLEWSAEYIYLSLQYGYYALNLRGAKLKSYMLKVIQECLWVLKNPKWDSGIIADFLGDLRGDWELEFYANYFLSENGFQPGLFREIITGLRQKCEKCSQETCQDCARLG